MIMAEYKSKSLVHKGKWNIPKATECDIGGISTTRIFHQEKRVNNDALSAIEEDKEFVE